MITCRRVYYTTLGTSMVREPIKSMSAMTIQTIHPDGLPKRVVNGHLLYSHVLVVEAGKLIFISGQLARNRDGQIVAPRDMRAQIKQVGENLNRGSPLPASGLTRSSRQPPS